MSALLNFERFVQGLVEGSIFRLTRTRVEPVEIARRLSGVMERAGTVQGDRIVVPSQYRVALNPDDFRAIEPLARSIEAELAIYLFEYALEHGLTLDASPQIDLEADAEVTIKAMRIDAAPTQPLGALPGEGLPIEATHHFTAVARPLYDGPPTLVRTDPAGAGWRKRLDEITRIGRGFDNDLILEERTVSRHHAEIRRDGEGGGYYVVDLDSTNGVQVNSRRVRQHRLRAGDRIRLGNVEFAFDTGGDAA